MEHHDPQLSQAYRDAAHPEPPSALDARILDAARQAVAKPDARRRPAWFGWAVPFSSVAVLVLGITLLFRIQHEAPEMLESPAAHPPAHLDQAAPAPVPAETATVPSAAEPASPPLAKRARPQAKDTVTAPEQAAPAGNAAPSAEEASGVPAPQPFPAQSGTLQTLPPPPPPAAKAEARSAPMPAPARDAAEAASGLADRSADMAAKPAAPAAAAPARMGAPALGRSLEKHQAEPALETPDQMLETIRRLMREGRVEEARQALDKLRRTYPGFVVPEDLQAIPVR